ncbi:PP2C family protein-serine/threonine phosphatase [Pseudodesulfovibrio piezophilus]|uniref:PPM-type phosphatase domain-containing protein n=1 Tax=Pseudodesulfovibrio piezophilus (strain DSM 21447 / JCM 15486 / C1TLV30) TaxID=1322246 RepID=M1WUT8_PSEP2|nr:protein phosphatase 2C domain-containing protein [Pseudodesulfovibrio piezophilus]CCH47858.1 protein of unknown function [Pseudodesulfovibrio piezophilus C1TLV30]
MTTSSVQYAYESLKGTNRTSNKDGVGAFDLDIDGYSLFAIFDGVSSLANAKNGVNLALRELGRIFYENKHNNDIDLVKIVESLNAKIRESKYKKPYTTCAILAIPKDKTRPVKIASLGDSRIYGVDKQFIEQLTEDHHIDGHPSVLTRYLGMEQLEHSDIFYKEFISSFSDYMLCTDGFCSLFEKDKSLFHDIFLRHTPTGAKKEVNKLIQGKNQDDATYIYVRTNDV